MQEPDYKLASMRTWPALEVAAKTGANMVPAFVFTDIDLVMQIDSKSYVSNMEKCLDHFEDVEDWDKCIILRNMKEVIENLSK